MLWLRLALLLFLLPLLVLGGMWVKWGRDLPSIDKLDSLEYSGITRVYDDQGQFLTTLTADGNRNNPTILSLKQMGPWLPKTVMESEDRRFYSHGAVDFMGVLRGLLKGLLRQDLEGGSTITQQVVKNTLLRDLNSARTAERKFKEALLASRLEQHFSKDQILNAYLNVVYWGHGGSNDLQGVSDAAQAYFRKAPDKLNLAESAYLATIIPAPNKRYHDFVGYRPLVKSLLGRMVEDRQITQAQADEAWNTPIYPSGWRINWGQGGKVISATFADETSLARHAPQDPPSEAPYFIQALQQDLLARLGPKVLYSGGKVYATINMQAQRSANQASLHVRRMPADATLGIALLDPQNGEVRALVGQKLTAGVRPPDWNNATQAKRQVGSSIKPLLYTLALSQGWKQSDRVLDAPIDDKDYQPKNYDGTYLGVPVTLRYALDHSLNLPTVRLAKQVGLDKFRAKLNDLGMKPEGDLGLSLAIGTLEASPLQMAAAYAPFANGGTYHAPALVRRVEDSRGKVIYERSQQDSAGKRVWDAQTAWLGLDMIRGVVDDLDSDQGGLATRARIEGWQVGGKTGTTNDIKDLWFVGTTSRLTGAVWVGKQAGGSLPQWAYSGTIPAPIWQAAMTGALQGVKPVPFNEPSGIEYAVVRRVKMAFRAAPAPAEPESSTPSWWPFGHKAAATEQPQQTPSAAQTPPETQEAPASAQQETGTQAQAAPTADNQAAPEAQAVTEPSATEAQPAPRVTLEPLPQPTPASPQPAAAAEPTQPTSAPAGGVQFQGNQGAVDVSPQH